MQSRKLANLLAALAFASFMFGGIQDLRAQQSRPAADRLIAAAIERTGHSVT